MKFMAEENNNNQANLPPQHIIIQKVYIKDVSYETPNSPKIFSAQWNPEVKMEMHSKPNKISAEENLFEVVLTITVTTKIKEETAFLVEVHQAGIFVINGYPEQQLEAILGGYCPGELFPFAREAVSDLVTKGGFPQLLLQPVNFDMLYQQHLHEKKAQAQANNTTTQ